MNSFLWKIWARAKLPKRFKEVRICPKHLQSLPNIVIIFPNYLPHFLQNPTEMKTKCCPNLSSKHIVEKRATSKKSIHNEPKINPRK